MGLGFWGLGFKGKVSGILSSHVWRARMHARASDHAFHFIETVKHLVPAARVPKVGKHPYSVVRCASQFSTLRRTFDRPVELVLGVGF